jgi:hypothetical protein
LRRNIFGLFPDDAPSFELPSAPFFFPAELGFVFFLSKAALNLALWSSGFEVVIPNSLWAGWLLARLSLQTVDNVYDRQEFL